MKAYAFRTGPDEDAEDDAPDHDDYSEESKP